MKRTMTTVIAIAFLLGLPAALLAHDGGCEGDHDCGWLPHGYSFGFGGYIKTDFAWERAATYPGNYVVYVPYAESDDDRMYITSRESRLGFAFRWKGEGVQTTAKVEYDFFGVSAAENKAGLLLRHAYVRMAWERMAVTAGQTWDVISPLNPKTVNYSVAWGQGNIGYRRPQLRFSTWGAIGDAADVTLDVAASRTIGNDVDGDGVDDGADAALPTVQGRLGMSVGIGDEAKIALGVSGHYGQEAWGVDDDETTDSWSANADLVIVPVPRITLMGEFFVGDNLQTYFGGVLQGVSPAGDALGTMGGWGMLGVTATDRVSLHAGYAFEDPDDADFTVPDGEEESLRDMNMVAWGNVFYGITETVTGIFEVQYLRTDWLTREGAEVTAENEMDNIRVQFAIKAAIR